eukprot:SM000279S10395  [mRNA]  locus=s279:126497:131115:- [translate_table: standard]
MLGRPSVLGNVQRYLLTPVLPNFDLPVSAILRMAFDVHPAIALVLSIASKYIKNAEDASVSDLRVSVTGGAVIFRNVELNIEVERTFARELHINIPWTSLATEPVEVLLEDVECIFSEEEEFLPSSNTASCPSQPVVEELVSDDEEIAQAGGGGWMSDIMRHAMNNVSVRVRNLVFKYTMQQALMTISSESITTWSATTDWTKGIVDIAQGLRKVLNVVNLTMSLDKLSNGRAYACKDPLLRSKVCSIKMSFEPLTGAGDLQHCLIDVDSERLQLNLNSFEITSLLDLLASMRQPVEQPLQVQADTRAHPQGFSETHMNGTLSPTKKEVPRGAVSQVTAAGSRVLGWAWNFIADEDAVEQAPGASQARREANQQQDEASSETSLDPIQIDFKVLLQAGGLRFQFDSTPDCVADVAVSTGYPLEQQMSNECSSSPFFIPTPELFRSLPEELPPNRSFKSSSQPPFINIEWNELRLEGCRQTQATSEAAESSIDKIECEISLAEQAHDAGVGLTQDRADQATHKNRFVFPHYLLGLITLDMSIQACRCSLPAKDVVDTHLAALLCIDSVRCQSASEPHRPDEYSTLQIKIVGAQIVLEETGLERQASNVVLQPLHLQGSLVQKPIVNKDDKEALCLECTLHLDQLVLLLERKDCRNILLVMKSVHEDLRRPLPSVELPESLCAGPWFKVSILDLAIEAERGPLADLEAGKLQISTLEVELFGASKLCCAPEAAHAAAFMMKYQRATLSPMGCRADVEDVPGDKAMYNIKKIGGKILQLLEMDELMGEK